MLNKYFWSIESGCVNVQMILEDFGRLQSVAEEQGSVKK